MPTSRVQSLYDMYPAGTDIEEMRVEAWALQEAAREALEARSYPDLTAPEIVSLRGRIEAQAHLHSVVTH